MSEAFGIPEGPICSALGCTEPAKAVIDHPDHGERHVCDEHADDGEVVRDV